ncbi:MAG: AAA family ATPase [Nanoarchaeota archaeon]
MIIERPEEIKRISEIKKWLLVYGRRKTGKTFLVTNFIKFDEYFFVKVNKTILTKNNESISYDVFIEKLRKSLEENKTVVVDEFHRLESEFFDFLHFMKKTGKLILISSTLFLSKKLISSKSPLLGLFAEVPIGLISLNDTLKSIGNLGVLKKENLELAILLREPIAVDYFDSSKKAREIIAEIILSSIKTVPALIGEIFVEEEREISAIYEGILRSIAIGKINSGEISSFLFSKKLIKKDDPSIIQQYLNNLISFGILKRIEIYNKKRFVYKLASPLAKIYYYIDEKYNLSERKISEKELLMIMDEIVPRIVEDNVREHLALKYGLSESIIETKDYDIDACLLKFKKPEIAIEIKWKNLNKEDIKKAEENLNKINAKRRILFVQNKDNIKSDLEVFDIRDL